MSISLVVLAAGIGSRYGGLKQLDAVGPSGETILHYSLFDAVREGFDKIVFVIRTEMKDELQRRLTGGLEDAVAVEYVFQDIPEGRKKPWGTAHAVMLCRDAVKEPFGVINADDFYGRESFGVLSGFLRDVPSGSAMYCLVSFELGKTLSDYGQVARGICKVGGDGFVESIVERTSLEKAGSDARFLTESGTLREISGMERVSMNMWGFTPVVFRQFEEVFEEFLAVNANSAKAEFYIPSVTDALIGGGKARVRALETNGQWFGITYREDKDAVFSEIGNLVEKGEYPSCIKF